MSQTHAKRRAVIQPEAQPAAIALSIRHLKNARGILRKCGCKNAADAVARALKSAAGAERHARNMAREAADARHKRMKEGE